MAASPSAKKYVGFKFDPTEEELVVYYLKRKIQGKKLPKGVIPEIEIYKFEPWELQGQSTTETEDSQLFFFCKSDPMCSANGANRCTSSGYWKITNNSNLVKYKSRVVGIRRLLVFHTGCISQSQQTDWFMDEYRLSREELSKLDDVKGDYVVCKVYQKPNAGGSGDYRLDPFAADDHDGVQESNDHQDTKAVVLPTDSKNGVAAEESAQTSFDNKGEECMTMHDATNSCYSESVDELLKEFDNVSLEERTLGAESTDDVQSLVGKRDS